MADELSRIDNPTQTVIPGETTVSESYGAQNTRAEGASNGFDGTKLNVNGSDIDLVASGCVDVNGVLYAVTNTATLTPSGDGVWYIKLTGSGENLTPVLQASRGTFDATKNGFYDTGLRVLNWEILQSGAVLLCYKTMPNQDSLALRDGYLWFDTPDEAAATLMRYDSANNSFNFLSADSDPTIDGIEGGGRLRLRALIAGDAVISGRKNSGNLFNSQNAGDGSFSDYTFLEDLINAFGLRVLTQGNFTIRRYDTLGVYQGDSIVVDRTTGAVTLEDDLIILGDLKANGGDEITKSINVVDGSTYMFPDNTTFGTIKGFATLGNLVAGSIFIYFETFIDGAWEILSQVGIDEVGTDTEILNNSICFQGVDKYRFRTFNSTVGGAPVLSIKYVKH